MSKPMFVIIEGGECTGKSTQMELLVQALNRAGQDAIATHEPGGTLAGEKIRGLLIGKGSPEMSSRTELFLFLAARSAWMEDVVEPAIKSGKSVVADRSYPSTFVYQGYAGGMPLDTIKQMNDAVMGREKPDLVVIVNISQKTMIKRMTERGEGKDRIEAKGKGFHSKVLKGYRQFAKDNAKGNVVIVNGEGDIDHVHRLIVEVVNNKLGLKLEVISMSR